MAGAVIDAYALLTEEARRAVRAAEESSAIRIQVGSATCENAAGAVAVYNEFKKHVEAAGRTDISLRRTGCTGRCSREPPSRSPCM